MIFTKRFFTIFLLFAFPVFSETISFDLGGPCLQQQTPTDFSESDIKKFQDEGKKFRDAIKNKDWDFLINKEKISVREDCNVPARWEFLFKKVVEAKRFRDAVGVLNEMKKKGIFLPHVVLLKTDVSFLKSPEFSKSELGMKFQSEQNQFDKLTADAKTKIKSMNEPERPPELYISEGACPFECCQLGKWKTCNQVQIFKDVRSSQQLFEIPKGVNVIALAGKVLREPEPYVVIESQGIAKQGDILFVLDYGGEGRFSYWYKGKLNPDLKTEMTTMNFYEDEQSNSVEKRWLKKIYPEKIYADEWWVKIQLADKRIGWLMPNGDFDGTDSCGH